MYDTDTGTDPAITNTAGQETSVGEARRPDTDTVPRRQETGEVGPCGLETTTDTTSPAEADRGETLATAKAGENDSAEYEEAEEPSLETTDTRASPAKECGPDQTH